ncbi:MAG TPA: hypothetical protein VL201_02975 [Patescibacteria group bacterium]|jgi:hypothetical protein|nr:hypothetical protein [Patescibacteria group bacterium]
MNVEQKALLLLIMLGTYRYDYAMENESTHHQFADASDDDSSTEEGDYLTGADVLVTETEVIVEAINTETDTTNIIRRNTSDTEESALTEIDLGEGDKNIKENDQAKNDQAKAEKSEQAAVNSDNPTTDQQKNVPVVPKVKYDPRSWATYLNDKKRGYLGNVIHELQTGGFNPDELLENTKRVNYAIDEAIGNNKSEELVQLISMLIDIKFKIPQTDADKAVKYLEEGITKNKDEFYVKTIEQVNFDNKSIDEKYNNLLKNCALPLIAFTLELQKKKTETEFYQSNIAQKLNNHFGAIRLLQDNKSPATMYTIEKLLIETKTDTQVVGLLNKNNEMLANIQQIQSLLTEKK